MLTKSQHNKFAIFCNFCRQICLPLTYLPTALCYSSFMPRHFVYWMKSFINIFPGNSNPDLISPQTLPTGVKIIIPCLCLVFFCHRVLISTATEIIIVVLGETTEIGLHILHHMCIFLARWFYFEETSFFWKALLRTKY